MYNFIWTCPFSSTNTCQTRWLSLYLLYGAGANPIWRGNDSEYWNGSAALWTCSNAGLELKRCGIDAALLSGWVLLSEWAMTKGSEPVRLSPESLWMIPPWLLLLCVCLWKGRIRNKNFKYCCFSPFLVARILCLCTHPSSLATHCCRKHHWSTEVDKKRASRSRPEMW